MPGTFVGRCRMLVIAAGLVLASGLPAAAGEGCAPPPDAVRSLIVTRFYSDRAGSNVDPDLKARHRKQVMPLVAFLRHVVKDADKAVRRTRPERAALAAGCALTWITAWAARGALLGTMASKQAQYQRKWDLCGLALAYLKVRRFASNAQRSVIEPWLIRLADGARAFFDDPARRRNNHWYWLGLGLGATALAVDSQRHWQMARGIMHDAARNIRADGTLRYEMDRGAKALKYHAFAAMPLVVLAELARARGEDWYALGDGALHRLVAVTAKGLTSPDIFDELAGVRQKRPVNPGAGWLPLYGMTFNARLQGPAPAMKNGHRWLGGDVFALVRILGRSK